MIRTSNYSLNAYHPDAIGISLGVPRFYKGPTYPPLFPPPWLVNKMRMGKFTSKTFIKYYMQEVLNKLDPQQVLDDLLEISPDPILLCHCGAGSFCHRKVVAGWLKKELGCEVIEVGKLNLK